MSTLADSGVVFACILTGAITGMILRAVLPERHLCTDTKDILKLGMGLIGTLTALVLGLLIASAKGSFDTQRNGLAQMSGDIIFLDRTLTQYGLETKDTRETLRASVTGMLQKTWPGENLESGQVEAKTRTESRYEGGLFEKIQELTPNNDDQRALKAQALTTATSIAQLRWLLFVEKGSSIPTPFLVVMVSWLTLILASFSLLAPPKPMAIGSLLLCVLAVSSAVFLILELDRPFQGTIQISSAPLRSALGQVGR
jgi:hypothetical protein